MRTAQFEKALLLGAVALGLTACASAAQTTPGSAYGPVTPTATASASPANTKTVVTIRKTSIGDVLTDAAGHTLYWYSKDVRDKRSVCTGGCLALWPAVTGKPVAAAGIKLNGVLGTINRGGGVLQATYNGYPLYTYTDDTAAGQTTGNDVGDLWHVITGKVLTSA
jgi:predicted lipoprotein with Yx(FWY)xxD motif